MKKIARIHTDFPAKFGVPRQSGLVKELTGQIIFEPKYRVREAFRGLEEYSHLWVVWKFSKIKDTEWHPTVRPPKLGGNIRMGVFATRSPFRPNRIGLSCVEILSIDWDKKLGMVITVGGIDMIDGTPIYDIKPYLPYADAYPDARSGFVGKVMESRLTVELPADLIEAMTAKQKKALCEVLAGDPRPSYQDDKKRVYGFDFAEFALKFTVKDKVLRVRWWEYRDDSSVSR